MGIDWQTAGTISNERRLMDTLLALAPRAFVVSHEPKHFRGGFWTRLTR